MKLSKITKKQIASFLPCRKKTSDKKQFGKVLIIAGSNGMAGAAVMVAKAALKAGAGLVTLAIVKSQQRAVIKTLPEVMTIALAENSKGTVNLPAAVQIINWQKKNKADVVLLGPGLGLNTDTQKFTVKVLKNINTPFILDADGLNAVSKTKICEKLFSTRFPNIITPHAGEAARLLKTFPAKTQSERIEQAAKLHKKTKGIVILKGHKTLILDGSKIYVNTTGNPALAKGGSGDILAGLIVGFWAQSGKIKGYNLKSAFEAALTAVYLHGFSADAAVKDLTERCVLATELLNYLPRAVKKVKA